MPRLIDTDSRADCLAAAVNALLAEGGPAALTMRRIAARSGVGTSSILHHLGSREHLLRVCVHRTSIARLARIGTHPASDVAGALLPVDDEDVEAGRAWLGWLDLWRCEEPLTAMIGRAREDERGELAHLTGFLLGADGLEATAALLDGLLMAVCRPVDPLPHTRARQLFTDHLAALGVLPSEEGTVAASRAWPRSG